MRATINNTLVKTLKPADKAYDIRDIKLTGFMIRVSPGGAKSYVCQYKRGKRVTIGKVGIITPAQARDRAKEILGDATKGIDPNTAKQLERKKMSLETFVEQEYQPWITVHRKVGEHTLARIKRCFYPDFTDLPLNKITIQAIEKWRTLRINQGLTKKT